MKVLEKTVCVMLSCTLWTGRRQLKPEDLGELAADLPPEDLASMGSLKLCDPAELRELARIKRRAERACERLAVKFLGGYATDEANLDVITDALTKLKADFEAAAQRVVGSLQGLIDRWVVDHPEWEEAIRRSPPDVNRIAARLKFDYQVIRIRAASDDDSPVNDGLERAVGGLSSQLYHEIAVQARTALKRSFEGKDSVGQRAIRVIRVISEKLDALSYLDGGIRPVLDKIRAVRAALPGSGEITGQELVEVMGLLSFLGDEAQLANFGTLKAANGASKANGSTGDAPETPDVTTDGSTIRPPREAPELPAPVFF